MRFVQPTGRFERIVSAPEATDAPFRLSLGLANTGEPIVLTPLARFVAGLLGGVFLGWMVELTLTLRDAIGVGSTGRPL